MNGRRFASLTLVGIFAFSLSIAASSGPLLAQAESIAKSKTMPHHFIGKITDINKDKNAFTIDLGNKKLVTVTNTQTKFFNYSGGLRTKSSFEAFKADLRVAVLGELKGSTLTAKLIALIPTKVPQRHAEAGKITAVGGSAISFDPTGKAGTTKSFNVTSSTFYTKKVGGKIERVTLSDLSVGDKVSFVGTVNDSGVITAKLVHVIPANSSQTNRSDSGCNQIGCDYVAQ